MPALFAVGTEVIERPVVATFAAFGSFGTLLLVDFGGRLYDRVRNQGALAVACGVLIAVATLCSRTTWLAAVAMAVVGFGVLFAGVASSVLAGATRTLLLSFILPISLPGSACSIPDRLAGWGMASAASLVAIAVLWPAPASDPVRTDAIAACRAPARRPRRRARAGAAAAHGARRGGRLRSGARAAARDVLRHALPADRAEHRRARGRAARRRAAVAQRDRRPRDARAGAGVRARSRGMGGRRDRSRRRGRRGRAAVGRVRGAARRGEAIARCAGRPRARGEHRAPPRVGRRRLSAGPELPRAGAQLPGRPGCGQRRRRGGRRATLVAGPVAGPAAGRVPERPGRRPGAHRGASGAQLAVAAEQPARRDRAGHRGLRRRRDQRAALVLGRAWRAVGAAL